MRSKNDAALIRDTLKMLYSQTITDFELINVDSGSTDGTVEIIQEFGSTLYQIKPQDYIPGKVLNDMVAKTTGDIIVFLNSDATPADENWLKALIDALGDDSTSVAFSRQLPRPDAYTLVGYDYNRAYPPQVSSKMGKDFISFAAVALKRSVWEKHRFYEEGLAEDQAWAHTLNENGFNISYAPASRVFHSHNLSLSSLYRKEYLQGGVAGVYIYKQPTEPLKEIFRLMKSIIRDIIYFIRHGKLLSIPYSIIFRITQHTAFYLGRVEGWKRLKDSKEKGKIDETVHLLREYTA